MRQLIMNKGERFDIAMYRRKHFIDQGQNQSLLLLMAAYQSVALP